MTVKRYRFEDNRVLRAGRGAEYVLASDYDALRAAVETVARSESVPPVERGILLNALSASEEATGDSLARSGPGAKA